MPPGSDLKIILSNLKGIFVTIGAIMLAMAILAAVSGKIAMADGFFYGAVIGISAGLCLHTIFPRSGDPELRHGMVIAAIAYLIVPAISSIPFMVGGHMGPLDAFFEAISGWTGTGFSMVPSPESMDPILLLWRSVTQWFAGLGVILLMVTILIRPGTSAFMLYQSEGRKDKLLPSIRSTLRVIWSLYLVLTIVAFVLLFLAGMPAWAAVNTALVAISTGGFSIDSTSITAYDSIPIELVLLPIMVTGALPFGVMYRAIGKKIFNLLRDPQVKAFIFIIALGVVLLSLENLYFYHDATASLRYSTFQFISAITSTGLQSADISQWSQSALVLVSIAMIIGGCAGSTTGGIKVARIIFIWNEIKLWLARMLRTKNSMVAVKIGGKRVTEDIIDQEMAEASLISFLWLFSIIVSMIALSHIVGSRYDLINVFFDVCSAQGNVGISCGIVKPELPAIGKILLMANMWIGRLEIIPVMVLARYVVKGFRI